MREQVWDYIHQSGMLLPGDRVVVAVSGGPDSVALLHLLHRLAPDLGLSLHVFHMNHGLRGDASDGDAAYVQGLAGQLGLPCTVVRLEPGTLKQRPGSLQANARGLRYAELAALAERLGAQRVALGHNRDDQAETVLMRLLRGAGTHGLAGIPSVRRAGRFSYIRPLLETSRQSIETYCQKHELHPRLDQSNLKPDYLRNRIRLELLPLLARDYNPAVVANLAQSSAVLREEDQFLDGLAAEAFARCRVGGEGVALQGSVLLAEPAAIARRVIRMAAREVAGPGLDLGLGAIGQVLRAATQTQGTHLVDLPDGLRLRTEYGVCRFELAGPAAGGSEHAIWPVAPGGETLVPELGLRVLASRGGTPCGPGEALFDARRLPGPLAIRLRHPGDRIWPAGMEGSKKLQDILVDAKVPQRLRDRIPLLVAGDDILWVIGYRLDRRYLAESPTEHALLVRVEVKE